MDLDKLKTFGMGLFLFGVLFLIIILTVGEGSNPDKIYSVSDFKKVNFFAVFPVLFAGVLFLLFIYKNKKIWSKEIRRNRFMYALGLIVFLFVLFTNLRYYLVLVSTILIISFIFAFYKMFGTLLGKAGRMFSKAEDGVEEIEGAN